MSPPPFTVVVADDHPMFRESLTRAVREHPDLALIGEETDGPTALATLEQLQPDVAIVDLWMPRLDGLALVRAATASGVRTRLILLAGLPDAATVRAGRAAGAAAVLARTLPVGRVLDEAHRAAQQICCASATLLVSSDSETSPAASTTA